jgi:peptide chain release factor subunit 3
MSKYVLNLFDTPGHRNYMSNMILALRLADVVVLVVSAKKGEFEAGMNGGTLDEILLIGNSFGVKSLVVIVSKMETTNWDRAVLNKI